MNSLLSFCAEALKTVANLSPLSLGSPQQKLIGPTFALVNSLDQAVR